MTRRTLRGAVRSDLRNAVQNAPSWSPQRRTRALPIAFASPGDDDDRSRDHATADAALRVGGVAEQIGKGVWSSLLVRNPSSLRRARHRCGSLRTSRCHCRPRVHGRGRRPFGSTRHGHRLHETRTAPGRSGAVARESREDEPERSFGICSSRSPALWRAPRDGVAVVGSFVLRSSGRADERGRLGSISCCRTSSTLDRMRSSLSGAERLSSA